MPHYRPVPKTYTPRYPRQLTEAELNELLRPALFKRFSKETMAASAVLVGAMFGGCAPRPYDPGPLMPIPKVAKSDPEFDARVLKLVAEVLQVPLETLTGPILGRPGRELNVEVSEVISENPPLKNLSERVGVSFGTGNVPVYNVDELRKGTARLFEFYGIPVIPDVRLQGEGFEFDADGFNRDYGVGFVTHNGAEIAEVEYLPKHPNWTQENTLNEPELPAVRKLIQDGKLKLFIAPGTGFRRDFLSKEAYYASVVDYLNSITGHGEFESDTVFNRRSSTYKGPVPSKPLPGLAFDDPDALQYWKTEGGTQRLVTETFGRYLELELQPGGKATYTPPTGTDLRGLVQLKTSANVSVRDLDFLTVHFLADKDYENIVFLYRGGHADISVANKLQDPEASVKQLVIEWKSSAPVKLQFRDMYLFPRQKERSQETGKAPS